MVRVEVFFQPRHNVGNNRLYLRPAVVNHFLRLRLSRPKANLVDAGMIRALHGALVEFHKNPGSLRGALLDAEGPHFSFGASVEEHLPAQCGEVLRDRIGEADRVVLLDVLEDGHFPIDNNLCYAARGIT